MSILVDQNTRLIVQGLTGSAGKFHAEQCQKYGTNLVGGVTPGRGGEEVLGVPVFNTVVEAVRETAANVTCIFVPAPFAADAILEEAKRILADYVELAAAQADKAGAAKPAREATR